MNPRLDAVVSILPLVILIYMMTKKKSIPSNIALPISAAMVYIAHLIYFVLDPNLVNATVVKGALGAGFRSISQTGPP